MAEHTFLVTVTTRAGEDPDPDRFAKDFTEYVQGPYVDDYGPKARRDGYDGAVVIEPPEVREVTGVLSDPMATTARLMDCASALLHIHRDCEVALAESVTALIADWWRCIS